MAPSLQASLAAGIVDAVLIPEVQFTLEGEKGLFAYLENIIETKGHCVLCVAEGAGQVQVRQQHRCAALQLLCGWRDRPCCVRLDHVPVRSTWQWRLAFAVAMQTLAAHAASAIA